MDTYLNHSLDIDYFKIASRYFLPNFYWILEDLAKNLQFYTLFLTESISIKPIFDKIDPKKIIFQNAHILKVLTEDEWGISPYKSKILPETDIS